MPSTAAAAACRSMLPSLRLKQLHGLINPVSLFDRGDGMSIQTPGFLDRLAGENAEHAILRWALVLQLLGAGGEINRARWRAYRAKGVYERGR